MTWSLVPLVPCYQHSIGAFCSCMLYIVDVVTVTAVEFFTGSEYGGTAATLTDYTHVVLMLLLLPRDNRSGGFGEWMSGTPQRGNQLQSDQHCQQAWRSFCLQKLTSKKCELENLCQFLSETFCIMNSTFEGSNSARLWSWTFSRSQTHLYQMFFLTASRLVHVIAGVKATESQSALTSAMAAAFCNI